MAFLIEHEPAHAIIEHVFKDPRLIDLKGEVKACFKLADVPLQHVAAKTWMKAVLGKPESNKPLSVEICRSLYPTADINRPTPKGKKTNPDHNRAESVLLAHYLHLTLNP